MMVPAVTTGLQALVDPPKWLAQRAGMDGVGHAADVPRAELALVKPRTAKQPQGSSGQLHLNPGGPERSEIRCWPASPPGGCGKAGGPNRKAMASKDPKGFGNP